MPLNTLLPAFNQDVLQGHADDLGYLISAMGGAIIGSLLMATMGDLRNKGFWPIASCIGWGAVTAVFGASSAQWAALASIAVIGMLSSWEYVAESGHVADASRRSYARSHNEYRYDVRTDCASAFFLSV